MMGQRVSVERVLAWREAARRLDDGRRAVSDEDALAWVNARGFAPLLTGCANLPSLADAAADEWEGAWRWKETLPQQSACAYGKFLRGRGFFVAWRLFPALYRLYARATDPERDYQDGLLARTEWQVLQVIRDEGPIDSRRLWREVKGHFGGRRPRFEQTMTALQMSCRIMVAGGSLEGWSLHAWDLVERHVPAGLLDRLPKAEDARVALLQQFVANTGACTRGEAGAFFHWQAGEIAAAAECLLAAGDVDETEVEGWKGLWLTRRLD
jgi:hypothetical protein